MFKGERRNAQKFRDIAGLFGIDEAVGRNEFFVQGFDKVLLNARVRDDEGIEEKTPQHLDFVRKQRFTGVRELAGRRPEEFAVVLREIARGLIQGEDFQEFRHDVFAFLFDVLAVAHGKKGPARSRRCGNRSEEVALLFSGEADLRRKGLHHLEKVVHAVFPQKLPHEAVHVQEVHSRFHPHGHEVRPVVVGEEFHRLLRKLLRLVEIIGFVRHRNYARKPATSVAGGIAFSFKS